jgi:phospholipid/cholesterol/gamma-HCH transport system ATP-binding protein
MFQDGNRLMEDGQFVDALEMYAAAYARYPNPKILLNMGTAYPQLGRFSRGREAEEEAVRRLEQVHLEGFADRYPSELGDGMRKRAAIARTLTMQPEVVLFDEPTTGLDPVMVNAIHRLILDLHRRVGFTAILVSHEIPEIFGIADRVAMLHEGAVVEVGTPEAVQASANPVVRQFITGDPEGPIQPD